MGAYRLYNAQEEFVEGYGHSPVWLPEDDPAFVNVAVEKPLDCSHKWAHDSRPFPVRCGLCGAHRHLLGKTKVLPKPSEARQAGKDGVEYFLVGKVGAKALGPGEATIIRKGRTAGVGAPVWSYLYFSWDDGEWQKKYAKEVANAEKGEVWGNWQDFDMVTGGRYPSVKLIPEKEAFRLIDAGPPGGTPGMVSWLRRTLGRTE